MPPTTVVDKTLRKAPGREWKILLDLLVFLLMSLLFLLFFSPIENLPGPLPTLDLSRFSSFLRLNSKNKEALFSDAPGEPSLTPERDLEFGGQLVYPPMIPCPFRSLRFFFNGLSAFVPTPIPFHLQYPHSTCIDCNLLKPYLSYEPSLNSAHPLELLSLHPYKPWYISAVCWLF